MLEGKKIIGVCITKMHDMEYSKYLTQLYADIKSAGWGLFIFNSFNDFYKESIYVKSAKEIYGLIDLQVVDALVIYDEAFYDKEIVQSIIDQAKAAHKPVIVIKGTYEGCYCIMNDYKAAYKKVIAHLIEDHGVRKPFFIGGRETEDAEGALRLACYREVLEEHGIEFSMDRVRFGEYWNEPVVGIMENLIDEMWEDFPDAIVCANDVMAVTVCDYMTERGMRVPDDLIVTGFDGIFVTRFHSPSITTCKEDPRKLAKQTMEILRNLETEELSTETIYKNEFVPVFGESCGCCNESNARMAGGCCGESGKGMRQSEVSFMDAEDRALALQLYSMAESMKNHEDYMSARMYHIFQIRDYHMMYDLISRLMLSQSYLAFKEEFVETITPVGEFDAEETKGKVLVLSSAQNRIHPGEINHLDEKEIVGAGVLVTDAACVMVPVYVGEYFCGFLTQLTKDIIGDSHKIKRINMIINLALNEIVNRLRENRMERSIENAIFTNPITKIPNLKGSNRWFEEFGRVNSNHQKVLVVSVYMLPKYSYIFDNYGIKDVEDALCFVADALKKSNETDTFIGQIADDEFLVINYLNDPNQVADTVNHTTSCFYQLVEEYNSVNKKDYYVEINAGCTVVHPGWKDDFGSFINLARGELYINRMKLGVTPTIKERASAKDNYSTFMLLLEKNLFKYAFQPIVDAKNGEIYAYEALMRTDDAIKMSPLEILDIAKEYKRLYDIERATLFNVLDNMTQRNEQFRQRKVFINSIPGHFLNEEDYDSFCRLYSERVKDCVIEITEQDSVTDDELARLKSISGSDQMSQIAIDDYGTGHSNIVNLLRYAPQIIKIDRFLIAGIDKDMNKQMFVKSTIEFARANRIKVLAEGVETASELHTVILYGVDYIQGYYTGRPVFDPVMEIDEEIKKQICQFHEEYERVSLI